MRLHTLANYQTTARYDFLELYQASIPSDVLSTGDAVADPPDFGPAEASSRLTMTDGGLTLQIGSY